MTPSRQGPLRVAMVTAFAYPLMAGIATHVDEVASRLGAAGVDVTVLTTDRTWELPVEEQLPDYRVRRWRAYPRSRDYYFAPGLARHLLRADDYDVVHVEGVHSLVAPTALAAARRAGIPSLLTLHTGGHNSGLRNFLRPVQWRLLKPLLRTTTVVATGENERDIFAAILGDTEGAIRLIRNGSEPLPVDHSAEKSEGSPLLVSVGRLERFKGHHRILRALPAILAQAPDARLVLVGAGPYEQPLRAMATELGVDDRVSVRAFGPERRGAMGKLVADADVFCLLSEYEGHPMAVLEALGAGTKVLLADSPGLSELGRAGLATTIALEAPPEQVAAAALAVAAAPRTAPPAIPSWADCAEEYRRLYYEVVA
jgi:glycosyltransferase involved in cell wall biosynthesis